MITTNNKVLFLVTFTFDGSIDTDPDSEDVTELRERLSKLLRKAQPGPKLIEPVDIRVEVARKRLYFILENEDGRGTYGPYKTDEERNQEFAEQLKVSNFCVFDTAYYLEVSPDGLEENLEIPEVEGVFENGFCIVE